MSDAQRSADAEAAALHADLDPLLLFARDLNSHEVADYWLVQVPVGLLCEVWHVQAEMVVAVREAKIPKLAFLCRNALELHVWAKYVSSSMIAAKRFHQDAYVDCLEVFNLLERVLQALDKKWHPVVQAATNPLLPELERVLIRDKVGLAMDELRTMKHLNVGQIASDVGHGKVFTLWNPILSKLVHSTAYNVLVAGKSMDEVGLFIVRELALELRATVEAVDVYLRANNLPLYGSR
jgi:hypothetical protein